MLRKVLILFCIGVLLLKFELVIFYLILFFFSPPPRMNRPRTQSTTQRRLFLLLQPPLNLLQKTAQNVHHRQTRLNWTSTALRRRGAIQPPPLWEEQGEHPLPIQRSRNTEQNWPRNANWQGRRRTRRRRKRDWQTRDIGGRDLQVGGTYKWEGLTKVGGLMPWSFMVNC